MAFDSATGKLVLFGGYVTRGNYHEFGDFLSDTWTWDGTRWSPGPATSSPVERTPAAMVYDPARQVIVLREGTETWTWNGTRWLIMGPSQSPPAPGFIEPMSWDGQHGVVLLFSGAQVYDTSLTSGPLNQIWSWNGSNWSQLATPNPAPDAPTLFAPNSGGGTVHSALAQVVYDSTRKVNVYFGHAGGVPSTWTFDGASWTQLSTTTGSASTFFSLTADEARSDLLLFGESGDTWTWDGVKWTPRNPAHSPSPRREASIAYDSSRHVVVLFGGHAGSAANLHEFNDTWTWNGSDWTQVA